MITSGRFWNEILLGREQWWRSISQNDCFGDLSDENTRKRQSANRPSNRSIPVTFARFYLCPVSCHRIASFNLSILCDSPYADYLSERINRRERANSWLKSNPVVRKNIPSPLSAISSVRFCPTALRRRAKNISSVSPAL